MPRRFLLEIGTEEIPVAYIAPALAQLEGDLAACLAEERLAHGEIRRFATPRRLAVLVDGLDERQKDLAEELTGPPVAASYRDGEPTKAALGFAKGHGVAVADLHTVETPKGEYLAVHKTTAGRAAAAVLADALPGIILGLRFPKTMTWGDGALRFARPIRWLVALLDDEILPLALGGLRAGRESRGRRQSGHGAVAIPAAADYEASLAAAGVVADLSARRDAVLAGARARAAEMGGRLVEDPELLETVTQLVESPEALTGGFDPAHLDLPRLVVVTAMKSHQRYFSVEDAEGGLMPGFVVVLNGARRRPELVREGNERVLAARLADARFYWDEDRRLGLAGMMKRLKDVVWLEGAGSVADRAARLARLAMLLADAAPPPGLDRDDLDWAARHCKADLASEMIKDGKEFTKLQGYMGSEYAAAEGVSPARCRAILEHVLPRQAGDALPESAAGVVLALADRLDAVVGFWLAGFAPTGSKDPYALRRQALAVLRLLLEKELPLCLADTLDAALTGHAGVVPGERRPELLEFFLGRLRGLLEEEGVAPDVFDAVVDTGETRVLDLRARALALNALRGDPAFEQLVTGARRVRNILAKEGRDMDPARAYPVLMDWAEGGKAAFGFDAGALAEDPERELQAALAGAAGPLLASADARDYGAAYRRLADLGGVIDAYFDGVMVNCEDRALRENRLAFLQNLVLVFLHFAEFSRVVLEGERED